MRGWCIPVRLAPLMFLWNCVALSLLRIWLFAAPGQTAAGPGFSDALGPYSWLLSDKGPFHHSQEFVDFTERYQQGFNTKYKIYR